MMLMRGRVKLACRWGTRVSKCTADAWACKLLHRRCVGASGAYPVGRFRLPRDESMQGRRALRSKKSSYACCRKAASSLGSCRWLVFERMTQSWRRFPRAGDLPAICQPVIAGCDWRSNMHKSNYCVPTRGSLASDAPGRPVRCSQKQTGASQAANSGRCPAKESVALPPALTAHAHREGRSSDSSDDLPLRACDMDAIRRSTRAAGSRRHPRRNPRCARSS